MNEKDAPIKEKGMLIQAMNETDTGHLTLQEESEIGDCELTMSPVDGNDNQARLTISMIIKNAKIAEHPLDLSHFPKNKIFIKGWNGTTVKLPEKKSITFDGIDSTDGFTRIRFTFVATSDDGSGKVGGPGF